MAFLVSTSPFPAWRHCSFQISFRKIPSTSPVKWKRGSRVIAHATLEYTPRSISVPARANRKSKIPWGRVVRGLLKLFLFLGIYFLSNVAPLLAGAASMGGLVGGFARLKAGELGGFGSGLTAGFLLILASEIGDKTFFISALLSMKYSKSLVLLGTMLALGVMTVVSVAIGQLFHALPASFNSSIPFDDYAAVALLCWFGFQNIRDALSMAPQDEEELEDAKEVVGMTKTASSRGRVITETFGLVFVAEWGDKSMLATVALAAAKSPVGVVLGGVTGHLAATIIAVLGGSYLGKRVSERTARFIGGTLFLIFAALTLFGVY